MSAFSNSSSELMPAMASIAFLACSSDTLPPVSICNICGGIFPIIFFACSTASGLDLSLSKAARIAFALPACPAPTDSGAAPPAAARSAARALSASEVSAPAAAAGLAGSGNFTVSASMPKRSHRKSTA
eukprot:Skav227106  [mRNA]  locus=scaffold199:263934:276641:- [translate_table: standard]